MYFVCRSRLPSASSQQYAALRMHLLAELREVANRDVVLYEQQ